jgi:hypothetical protein
MVVSPDGRPIGRGPCLADEATDGVDGVGEVEERVDGRDSNDYEA